MPGALGANGLWRTELGGSGVRRQPRLLPRERWWLAWAAAWPHETEPPLAAHVPFSSWHHGWSPAGRGGRRRSAPSADSDLNGRHRGSACLVVPPACLVVWRGALLLGGRRFSPDSTVSRDGGTRVTFADLPRPFGPKSIEIASMPFYGCVYTDPRHPHGHPPGVHRFMIQSSRH